LALVVLGEVWFYEEKSKKTWIKPVRKTIAGLHPPRAAHKNFTQIVGEIVVSDLSD
jgi:hypothetical protein